MQKREQEKKKEQEKTSYWTKVILEVDSNSSQKLRQ